MTDLNHFIARAIHARRELFDDQHVAAIRLFNGHLEGLPGITVDIFGKTLVIGSTNRESPAIKDAIQEIVDIMLAHLPWIRCAISKTRRRQDTQARKGIIIFGSEPDVKVSESGIWYALNLRMHQDASFYLDTRNLRRWALKNLGGKTLLNCFAYTGSLGVAALAGGASRVLQLDLHSDYLELARQSYALNGLWAADTDFLAGDFWVHVGRMKRSGETFDCVILDPPFFSTTSKGRLDLNMDSARLINKVRPLVNDGGWIVSVNNAVYLSGQEYMRQIEILCRDGYLGVAEIIPVPEDCTGAGIAQRPTRWSDPTPFNHSTKIMVLKVRRKKALDHARE